MACPNCGSWAVKADRSLAGRMVCARCGQLLGVATPAPRRQRSSWRLPPLGGLGRWKGWLGLGLLVAISALLAARIPQPQREPSNSRHGAFVVPIR